MKGKMSEVFEIKAIIALGVTIMFVTLSIMGKFDKNIMEFVIVSVISYFFASAGKTASMPNPSNPMNSAVIQDLTQGVAKDIAQEVEKVAPQATSVIEAVAPVIEPVVASVAPVVAPQVNAMVEAVIEEMKVTDVQAKPVEVQPDQSVAVG